MYVGSRINCNVFGYDYSGYGSSSGRASEKNLYADIEAAWQVYCSCYDFFYLKNFNARDLHILSHIIGLLKQGTNH